MTEYPGAALCTKIKALHPDILDRLPDGVYRCMLAGPDERQVSMAAAWAAKRPARDADLDRLREAVERY